MFLNKNSQARLRRVEQYERIDDKQFDSPPSCEISEAAAIGKQLKPVEAIFQMLENGSAVVERHPVVGSWCVVEESSTDQRFDLVAERPGIELRFVAGT